MRFMHWDWSSYLALPEYHRQVLIDMIQDEQREARRQQQLSEVRRARRR